MHIKPAAPAPIIKTSNFRILFCKTMARMHLISLTKRLNNELNKNQHHFYNDVNVLNALSFDN